MWQAIAGGAAALGGSVIDYFGQKEANRANARMAREQMDFQERMSSTAYQRAVKDMRAAGVNPMMAYKQGGATTPSGQTATMQNPAEGLGDSASKVISTAMQKRRLDAEIDLLENQSKSQESTYWLNSALEGRALAEQRNISTNTAMNLLQMPGLENIARVESGQVGKYGAYVDKIAGSVGKVFGAGSSVKSLMPSRYQKLNVFDKRTGEIFK